MTAAIHINSQVKLMKFVCIRFMTLLIVAAVCYFSTYLALVQRQPVHYGNHLIQISLIPNQDDSSFAGNPIQPDTYRAEYRIEGGWIESLFKPAHLIDRMLRPGHWPLPDPHRISC